jgi:hypothetical protein
MKNEKWATIISGQPRADLIKAKNDYQNFIQDIEIDPDVFSHMMISNDILSGWGNGGWNKITSGQSTELRSTDEALSIWNPKKFLIEDYNNFEFKKRENNLASGLSMTYGIKKSFELLSEYESENNFKYDYVIRWRYDLHLNSSKNLETRKSNHRFLKDSDPLFAKLKEPFRSNSCDFWGSDCLPQMQFIEQVDDEIDWDYIKYELSDKKTIFLSPGWNWGDYGCCDLFLIGTRESMELYSKYHDEFEELRPKYTRNEGVLRHYLEKSCNFRVLNYYFGDVGIHR